MKVSRKTASVLDCHQEFSYFCAVPDNVCMIMYEPYVLCTNISAILNKANEVMMVRWLARQEARAEARPALRKALVRSVSSTRYVRVFEAIGAGRALRFRAR